MESIYIKDLADFTELRVWLGCNKRDDAADAKGEPDISERRVCVREGEDAPVGETKGLEDGGGVASAAEGRRSAKRMLDMLI